MSGPEPSRFNDRQLEAFAAELASGQFSLPRTAMGDLKRALGDWYRNQGTRERFPNNRFEEGAFSMFQQAVTKITLDRPRFYADSSNISAKSIDLAINTDRHRVLIDQGITPDCRLGLTIDCTGREQEWGAVLQCAIVVFRNPLLNVVETRSTEKGEFGVAVVLSPEAFMEAWEVTSEVGFDEPEYSPFSAVIQRQLDFACQGGEPIALTGIRRGKTLGEFEIATTADCHRVVVCQDRYFRSRAVLFDGPQVTKCTSVVYQRAKENGHSLRKPRSNGDFELVAEVVDQGRQTLIELLEQSFAEARHPGINARLFGAWVYGEGKIDGVYALFEASAGLSQWLETSPKGARRTVHRTLVLTHVPSDGDEVKFQSYRVR